MREQDEYAGFQYYVERGADGKPCKMIPVEGQHSAAAKERHRMAARECLIQDEAQNRAREMSK